MTQGPGDDEEILLQGDVYFYNVGHSHGSRDGCCWFGREVLHGQPPFLLVSTFNIQSHKHELNHCSH